MLESKIIKKYGRLRKIIYRTFIGILLVAFVSVAGMAAFALGYFLWAGNGKLSYDADAFYAGDDTAFTVSHVGTHWSVGFAKTVITPEGAAGGRYYLAGYANNVRPDRVLDDLYVRAVYLNDNTGRGGTVFCVIDCVGLSNHDILRIRRKVKEYSPGYLLKAINVSSTHTHAGIDTQGLWGDPLGLQSGIDEKFQKELVEKAALTIAAACADAIDGKLFAGRIQDADLFEDVRMPEVVDSSINCIKFVPDNAQNASLYLVNAGMHPETLVEGNTAISADFPAYMGRYIAEHAGADFMWVTGAQGAMIDPKGLKENCENIRAIQTDPALDAAQKDTQSRELREAFTVAFGERIGEKVLSITDYTEIEPLLNIRIRQISLPVENFVLVIAGKTKLINNDMVLSDKGSKTRYSVRTEAGIAQLGSFVNIALCPGELSPEIAVGGFLSAEESANGYAMDDVTPLYEILGAGKFIMVFGLTNDQIGYILPDNDYAVHAGLPYVKEATVDGRRHYEETVSTGKDTCRLLLDAWKGILEDMEKFAF